jgi:hypothetical protein
MPDLNTIEGFSDLLSPNGIYVLENKNKEPYIGLIFHVRGMMSMD